MYACHEYWEKRYTEGVMGYSIEKGIQSNEWYLEYRALQSLLRQELALHCHIVILGNGLSLMAEEMVADGFQSILAVDYSDTCIQRMQQQQDNSPTQHRAVVYKLMDVTALQVQDRTMDAVLDKATLDCLMNHNDWQDKVLAMLKEAQRVLRVGGNGPEDRLHILAQECLNWQLLQHLVIPKNKVVFHAYVFENGG